MKFLTYLLFFIFSISYSYSYIDPGTGGYILSSIWGAITGFFALLFAIIVKFFRHTLKNWYMKNKLLFISMIIIIIVIIGLIINHFFFYDNKESTMEFMTYDEDLAKVIIFNEDLAYDGYTLFEGKLMDPNGNIIRDWNYTYLSILDKEGNYYAQISEEGPSWGKFTFNDTPIWIDDTIIHHEIYETINNTIITFTKEPKEYNGRIVEFDVILEYDKNGTLIDKWSTWDALKHLQQFHNKLELDRPPNAILPENHFKNTSVWGANYDYYHLNSFAQVPRNSLENEHRAFKPGNWIINFRHGSMTFILDKDTKEVLWRAIFNQVENNLEGQHVARMIQNGNVIIFDNGRYREYSRLVEINPVNLTVEWEYGADDFYTSSQGYYQILPNGNYFITETENGKLFEITREGEKVWQYYNEDKYNETEYNETVHKPIYRASKYDRGFIENLIQKWD